MAIQGFKTKVGLGKETTFGTAVVPSFMLPNKAPKPKDIYKQIVDSDLRGSNSKDQQSQQGTGHSEVDLDFPAYPDLIGNMLMALLGTDTPTGAGPTYSHALTQADAPPSYSITDYDGVAAKVYAGQKISDLTLKYATDGDFRVTSKSTGKVSASAATPATAFTTAQQFLGWQSSVTIGGVANNKMIDFELSLKRVVELVWGAGDAKDVTDSAADALEVTGKMTFVPSDHTELNYYLNDTQPTCVIVITSGTNVLTLQMSVCSFESPTEIQRGGKAYPMISASFRAIYNATDAGSIKATLVNGQSASY
jgi:hypothetical protein